MPDDWFVVQFESEDGKPYVEMPLGIDLFEVLETLKAFYLSCIDDPGMRARYFRSPELSKQLDRLSVLKSFDIDKFKIEAAGNPVVREWLIGMITGMVHQLRSELPIPLLANIVALELLRMIDDAALQQLLSLDRTLVGQLLDRLDYLVGDGFEVAHERIVRQVHEQIFRD
ncbi:hypothetical protein [Nocardia thailandica]|uniref:hypothetical protein n=1 Tax=Nocardia thailandica TaxID=257275 RepID=UPI0002D2F5F2|nr:hypothetical protein [Nocardia thailandica]